MFDLALPQQIRLDERSLYLRKLVMRALIGGGRGHVGSAMSLIEIFRVLYDEVLNYQANDPQWANRDRCILSKGHGCLALYAMLADKSFFPMDALDRFSHYDSILGGHPEITTPGVEASTGALGHGLAIGIGMAIAAKIRKQAHRIFVIMGDGETNEGSVWESAMAASQHRLDNIVAMIDYNKLQSYGETKEVLDLEPIVDKWQSFGFFVEQVNGHNVKELKAVLTRPYTVSKPRMIICHTVKAKGLPFAENDPSWHHKSKLKPEELEAITQALGGLA